MTNDRSLSSSNFLGRVEEELADVFTVTPLLAHQLSMNVKEIVERKLEINEGKYQLKRYEVELLLITTTSFKFVTI